MKVNVFRDEPGLGWDLRATGIAAVLAVCCALGAWGFADPAGATAVQFCNYSVAFGERCPSATGSGHPRHTYHSVSANMDWGCGISTEMYVAYTNSIASSPKYTASSSGCLGVGDQFPNNTDLLRPYTFHTTWNSWILLRGTAAY